MQSEGSYQCKRAFRASQDLASSGGLDDGPVPAAARWLRRDLPWTHQRTRNAYRSESRHRRPDSESRLVRFVALHLLNISQRFNS